MYRSCIHLVWAIILHMINIILFCLLIMAIYKGMLSRWLHLIWLCTPHSTEVVLSLKRGVSIIQMKNKLAKRLIRPLPLLFTPAGAHQRHGKIQRGFEKHKAAVYSCRQQTNLKIPHPLWLYILLLRIIAFKVCIFAFLSVKQIRYLVNINKSTHS